jgi:HAMP domain-containing protein
MDAQHRFVVEVVGALRERREIVRSRVAQALGIDDEKAEAVVARMPGIITKPLPETRAAKVALRLQAVGIAAVHRPHARAVVAVAADAMAHVDVAHRRAADAVAHDAVGHHAVGHHAVAAAGPTTSPLEADAADLPLPPSDPVESALAGVPSIDATLIDEPDVDPKLTPMSEAGFGAADVVLPFSPRAEWPAPRDRRGRSTIVEGGATAAPGTPTPARDVRAGAEIAHNAGERDPVDASALAEDDDVAITMIRKVDEEPDVRYRRSGRSTPHPEGQGTPAAPLGPAPAARARDAIARDRAVGLGEAERPPFPELDERSASTQERAYRSTRSSAESPLTLSAPPEAVLKSSGVPEEALETAHARRRGSFGRRLSSLVTIPLFVAWAVGSGFSWLLLPSEGRLDLWIPLVAAGAVAALLGVLVANVTTSRMGRDVTSLRDDAERIAMGDLAKPVELPRNDDLGDLADAVERMRLSLQEGLERLRRKR